MDKIYKAGAREYGIPISQLTSKKLLVVEDNLALLKLLESILREVGYETVVATTGIEAIEMISHNKFDLAVIDYGLPDALGTEIAVRFQTLNPGAKILFITGKSDQLTRALITSDKILMTWQVLEKPFLASVFIVRIEQMLSNKLHI